jgi:hypothetical protein
MSRRRATLAFVAAVALAGVAALVFERGHADGVTDGGPLACGECSSGGTSAAVSPGETVTWGGLVVRNNGSDDARIDGLQLVDPSAGLELVAQHALVPNGREPLVGLERSYPPARPGGRIVPVAGHVLPPARNQEFLQFLLAFRAPRAGSYDLQGVEVDYTVGGRRYRTLIPERLRLCAPRTVTCHPPPPR